MTETEAKTNLLAVVRREGEVAAIELAGGGQLEIHVDRVFPDGRVGLVLAVSKPFGISLVE
ncbi:MAG: hypothetical protein ABIP48_01515 [Planctomycetota bacterium]